MTREEWLTSTNPGGMLVFATGRGVPDRKLLLFAIACVRRQREMRGDLAGMSQAIEAAERIADGIATSKEQKAARDNLDRYFSQAFGRFGRFGERKDGFSPALIASNSTCTWAAEAAKRTAQAAGTNDGLALQTAEMIATVLEQKLQADTLRCIVGNPFTLPQPVPAALSSSSVRSLAEGIYQDHAFDRLPILADALEEAGCAEPDVLTHCRGSGPHTRGCWVVDWILGKHGEPTQDVD
jgi:hypothetical protein